MSISNASEKKKVGYTRNDKIFLGLDWLIVTLYFIVLVYPIAYIIMCSFSAGEAYMNLTLIPDKFSLEGYKAVFGHSDIWIGYKNSILYTVSFTVVALVVTICCAFALSRKDFGGGKIIMGLCVFTMYFGGGLIPTYVWMRSLKMIDSVWAILLPGSLSVYNMIVMRTYFQNQIPEELREASMLDGCSDFRFLISIVLPLSGAIIAVISLYYAVGMWNDYFNPMVYLSTRNKLPLPNFLREILMVNVQQNLPSNEAVDHERMQMLEARAELMKYSLIIVSSVPVMIIYPFVQKHFVKGVMIGAIKG